MAVANLDLHAHGRGEGGNADPVEAIGAQFACGEFRIGAYSNAMACGVDLEDVERRGRGDLETLALAYGEAGDTIVMADDGAIGGDEFAGGLGHGLPLLFEIGSEELLVVAAGDEADLLRVRLFGESEAALAGHFADFGLGEAAKREEGVSELLLGEAEEEVSLVLGEIGRTLEDPAAALRVELVDGVVASGDAVGADGARGLEELIELEVIVAKRAGNGRAAGEVLADEGTDNILLEALFLIDDVVGDAEALGDTAGVIHIVQGTATAGLGRVRNAVLAGKAGLIPKLEGEPNDGLARVGEDGRDRRGVDSSGHGDGNGAGWVQGRSLLLRQLRGSWCKDPGFDVALWRE